ncbi:condensation domain-containing protein, partial [Streptomyces sp. SMC 277]|nr:condensation domain-containing protein [Streptomyces antimicrobicus]
MAEAAAEQAPAAPAEDEPAGALPLTPIAAWLAERGGSPDRYHQATLLQVPAALTEDHLVAAVRTLMERHAALRMRLLSTQDAPFALETAPAGDAAALARDAVHRVDVTGADDAALAAAVARHTDEAVAHLAPRAGRMLRAVWYDAGPDRPGRLLLVAHHLVVDGVSWSILLPDLAEAHGAAAQGRTPAPAVPGTSLRTWARELTRLAATPERTGELPYWQDVLSAVEPRVGTRPLDPAVDTAATERSLSLTLPAPVTEALLTTAPAVFHARVHELLLAALVGAVRRWREARGAAAADVLVDVEGHGREDVLPGADVSRTVGWFTSVYPVRFTGGAEEDPQELLTQVKETLRAVPDNGIGYGLLRYTNPGTRPALAALPTPQIAFNYLGRLAGPGRGDWTTAPGAAPLSGGYDPSMPLAHAVELNTYTEDGPDGPTLTAVWNRAGELLGETEARHLADLWFQELRRLADRAGQPGAGRFSPSDLPLVTLDQQQIDRLTALHPGAVDILPVAPLQQGLLFHALFDDAGPDVYTVQFLFDLQGPLDADALRAAAGSLLDRHPNLRAGFHHQDLPHPVQVIPGTTAPGWAEHDLSALSGAEQQAELTRIQETERRTRFDLQSPPLLRFTLVALGDDRHRLVFTHHHLLLDGWSMPLYVAELLALYAGRALPAATPYRDYLAWLTEQDAPAAEDAWRQAFAGVEEPTLLAGTGLDTSTPVAPDQLLYDLPADLTAAVTATARRHGLTLATVVQGAWALLLGALTGRDDVVFGGTVSGRPPEVPGIESMVGLFINTLPVRVTLDPAESAAALLARVQDEQSRLLPHQHLGLADVQRLAGIGELFDTITVLENYPLDPARLSEPGLAVTGIDGRDATHYPLSLAVMPGERLHLRLNYRPDAFTADAVDRIVRRFEAVLRFLADRAQEPVGRLTVLLDEERGRLEAAGLPGTAPQPQDFTSLFTRQVTASPDAPALRFGTTDLTYRELDERAAALAGRLAAAGAGPERIVAVALPRSPELVVTVLAVLRTGAAYLPVDPAYPAERIAYMLDDARPALVVTTGELAATLPGTAPTYLVDGEQQSAAAPLTPSAAVRPQTPAYVIYTSGSTGRPKGVVVTHAGVASLVASQVERFEVGPGCRVLQFASPSFDAAFWELVMGLLTGATLVAGSPEELTPGPALAAFTARHGITHATLPPVVLGAAAPGDLASL